MVGADRSRTMSEGGYGSDTVDRHLSFDGRLQRGEQRSHVLEARRAVVGTDPSIEETVDRIVIQALAKGHASSNAATAHGVTSSSEADARGAAAHGAE